jgi:hypothetical protein
VEQDLALEVQVEEVEVDNKEALVQLIQQLQQMDSLALLILVVEVEPEDQTVVLVLEQEVVDQGQLSLDFQDHQDLEYQ